MYIYIYILSKFVPSGQTSQCVSVDVWYGSLAKIGMVSGWVINSTVSTCPKNTEIFQIFHAVSIVWNVENTVWIATNKRGGKTTERIQKESRCTMAKAWVLSRNSWSWTRQRWSWFLPLVWWSHDSWWHPHRSHSNFGTIPWCLRNNCG